MSCICNDIIDRLARIEELLRSEKRKETDVWMNIEQAAEYIKKKKTSIYKMTMNKEIPHYKHGKKLVFLKKELDEHVSEGKVKNHPIQ